MEHNEERMIKVLFMMGEKGRCKVTEKLGDYNMATRLEVSISI